MSGHPTLVDTRELAALLGVHRSTILRGRHTHPLYRLGFKLGGHTSPLRWRRTDVDAYLETRRTTAA